MTIDEIYNFLSLLSNKNQSGGFTPYRFNLAIKQAYDEYLEKEYKSWQSTQKITDDLKVFLKNATISADSNGKCPYPVDYRHLSSCRGLAYYEDECGKPQNYEVELKAVNNDELSSYLSSSIVSPTMEYPILSFYDTYIQVYPKNIGTLKFDYLRQPNVPYWDYDIINNKAVFKAFGQTITANNNVYGQTVSVPRTSVSQNLELPQESHNAIVFIMCNYLGINLSNSQLEQYAELMKSQTIPQS